MKAKITVLSYLFLIIRFSLLYAETIDEKFNNSKAFEYSQKGSAYFNKGDFQSAIEEFKKSDKLFPDYYMTYSNLGYAYLYSRKTDEASEYFKKALSLNPQCSQAIRGMGTMYLFLNNNVEAEKYFKEAIRIYPDSMPSYMALGEVYNNQKRYSEAIPLLEKVIASNPNFVRAYIQIAVSYSGMEDFESSYEYIKKAQKLNPNDKSINDVVLAFEDKLKSGQIAKETIWQNSAFQESKGETMDLVDFSPLKISLPFNIKYPAKWYIREEISDMSVLLISREPIRDINGQYKVGLNATYNPDYFISREPNNTALGKMAKAVVKIGDWEKEKERYSEHLKKKGYAILTQTEIDISGRPALRIECNSSLVRIMLLHINLGKDAITLIFEAPPDEYNDYRDIFEQMIKSFTIRDDFKVISVAEEAARITQEQIEEKVRLKSGVTLPKDFKIRGFKKHNYR